MPPPAAAARSRRWRLPQHAAATCQSGGHGLDFFLYLLGERAQVTGAQLSRHALGQAVEDYASVLLRSESGVLGAVEVGNTFPGMGTDGETKVAGRDAICRNRVHGSYRTSG